MANLINYKGSVNPLSLTVAFSTPPSSQMPGSEIWLLTAAGFGGAVAFGADGSANIASRRSLDRSMPVIWRKGHRGIP